MTDEEALKLGRELAELADPTANTPMASELSAAALISLGRIAVKLATPYVIEAMREPSGLC